MYRFLLIEDSKVDADACIDTIQRMNKQRGATDDLEIVVATTFKDALDELKKDYCGAIVDIKLDDGSSGNKIIKQIIESYRIPVAVMTGTPDTDLEDNSPIKIYTKGKDTYEEIILTLIRTVDTGLFNVIGGKGTIEKTMNHVFWNNLYPRIHIWEELKSKGQDTEKILLRYAIAHIQELLDVEVPMYVTEETYIKTPITDPIRTGTIIKAKTKNTYYVVLSPPCDLAIHGGVYKTDWLLLCEIDQHEDINAQITVGATSDSRKKRCIEKAIKNNHTEYYHWLPFNSLFDGGYLNFRKVSTYSPESMDENFLKAGIRVQEYFVKSLLCRFSSYYARQGQPDFDFDAEASAIVDKMSRTGTAQIADKG